MNAFTFDLVRGEDLLHGVFIDRPAHITYGEIADELYNGYRSDLTVANLVIIRPPVDQSLPSLESAAVELARVIERLPHLPLHLLGSVRFKHMLTRNLNGNVTGPLRTADFAQVINHLRQHELEHYATDAR